MTNEYANTDDVRTHRERVPSHGERKNTLLCNMYVYRIGRGVA